MQTLDLTLIKRSHVIECKNPLGGGLYEDSKEGGAIFILEEGGKYNHYKVNGIKGINLVLLSNVGYDHLNKKLIILATDDIMRLREEFIIYDRTIAIVSGLCLEPTQVMEKLCEQTKRQAFMPAEDGRLIKQVKVSFGTQFILSGDEDGICDAEVMTILGTDSLSVGVVYYVGVKTRLSN